jgi:hypothetical protein
LFRNRPFSSSKLEKKAASIYSKNGLKDTGIGFKKPPSFMWVPSNHLIRVGIIRACYIKDIEKFAAQNYRTEYKMGMDGLEVIKPTVENVLKNF